jgi:NAD(P)-dependent dehydrogenase (short-subunit alcohol dehydrogenase family)
MDYRKLFDISGRVAVVIGAGSGIGESAAKGLAAHGAFVVCADLHQQSAERAADEIGGGAWQTSASQSPIIKTRSSTE